CWLHTPPERVNTQAAPAPLLSRGRPRITVLPPAEMATEKLWLAAAAAPVPTSLAPCWIQLDPLRVKIQAAPVELLSPFAPTINVFPSAEIARADPWLTKGETPP